MLEGKLFRRKPRKRSIPAKKSLGEETLAFHMKEYKIPAPMREYVFAHPRKYRFDFAWPAKMIAVEVEGGTAYGKSRHSQGKGFENDCRKYNLAVSEGWKVYRFSTEMVSSAEAVDFLRSLF